MKILFVIDRIELKYFEFNNLVTNFWMIKELLNRHYDVFITTIDKLSLYNKIPYSSCAKAFCKSGNIFYEKEFKKVDINEFDAVIFRPDPPVDLDYINATYIIDFATNPVKINNTQAIRDFNEKLHAVNFIEFMPPNLVSASIFDIESFLKEHKEIILKPLNRCFGSGVMYLYDGDPNTRSIINSLTNNGTSVVMVQKYIPAVKQGDKRVLILGEEVLDECIMKLPSSDDFKFNTHDDNYIRKAVLTQQEKENFKIVAKKLNALGIYMAGLDVIDGQIIEVNVTSPCYFIKEINNYFGTNLEIKIIDYLESLINQKKIEQDKFILAK